MVAGSGATEEVEEKEAAPGIVEVDVHKHSEEGVPGPITRLFVIANRGIANLVQDLILVSRKAIIKVIFQPAMFQAESTHCLFC